MHLFSWFLLSYNGSFARVWINTSLNTQQALTSAPDNLLLFSLPGAVGVSEAQKCRCARISLTHVYQIKQDILLFFEIQLQ
jgi:hypothetical protein